MASKRGLYKKATTEGGSTSQNEKRCDIYSNCIGIVLRDACSMGAMEMHWVWPKTRPGPRKRG